CRCRSYGLLSGAAVIAETGQPYWRANQIGRWSSCRTKRADVVAVGTGPLLGVHSGIELAAKNLHIAGVLSDGGGRGILRIGRGAGNRGGRAAAQCGVENSTREIVSSALPGNVEVHSVVGIDAPRVVGIENVIQSG